MAAARLVPSDRTALLISVRLPTALGALRRRSIDDARAGMPAHITLLYPFAQPAAIDDGVLAAVARTVGAYPALEVRLFEGRRWPDTLYVAVAPEAPLVALQAALAASFPSLPLYAGAFPFAPHVSIVEGPGVSDHDALAAPAWRSLPVTIPVRSVDLFVREGDRWHRRQRFALDVRATAAG